MLDLLFGTVAENAKREYGEEDRYDPETGTRTKSPGDRVGDFFTGRGNAIDRAVQQRHIQQLQEEYDTDLRDLQNLPGYEPLEITKNTKGNVIAKEIKRRRGVLNALQEMQGSVPDFDTSKLGSNPSIGQIRGAGLSQLANQQETKQNEERDRRLDRQERLFNRQDLSNERARKDDLMFRRDNLQFQYAQLAQADRQRAQDRQDKALMLLIRGLQNVGQAFTV